MKLTAIQEIKGKLILKSGLHIGAGDTEMRIGGTDNPVVKHPHTLEPYIPGSSIKGKVRALLELGSGLMALTDGKPLSAGILRRLDGEERLRCEAILKLFGSSGADLEDVSDLGPTRASFADCSLHEEYKRKALDARLPLFEVKSENSINRIKGTAENPRFTERVPAETEFEFSVTLKRFDEEQGLYDLLLEGLKLLEMDALGGSGSRGYGRVSFLFDEEDVQRDFARVTPLR